MQVPTKLGLIVKNDSRELKKEIYNIGRKCDMQRTLFEKKCQISKEENVR